MPNVTRVVLRLVLVGGVVLPSGCQPKPTAPTTSVELPSVRADALRPVAAFAMLTDADVRARALFEEMSRVLLHPRCVNCHPAGDSPTQHDDMRLHDPPVARGETDRGVPGLECTSCHQSKNLAHARVPGAPSWHLAPRSMTWAGRTPAALCEQLKDPARNGNKTLAEIAKHAAEDPLVAWGWTPGHGRTPAPGTQAAFGELVAAWVDAGAACPAEPERAKHESQEEK